MEPERGGEALGEWGGGGRVGEGGSVAFTVPCARHKEGGVGCLCRCGVLFCFCFLLSFSPPASLLFRKRDHHHHHHYNYYYYCREYYYFGTESDAIMLRVADGAAS